VGNALWRRGTDPGMNFSEAKAAMAIIARRPFLISLSCIDLIAASLLPCGKRGRQGGKEGGTPRKRRRGRKRRKGQWRMRKGKGGRREEGKERGREGGKKGRKKRDT